MEWKWLEELLPANEFHLSATQQQKMALPENAPNKLLGTGNRSDCGHK